MSLTDLAEELITKQGPYKEGYDAYWDGIMYEQNPYLSSSNSFLTWQKGWLAAEETDCEHEY